MEETELGRNVSKVPSNKSQVARQKPRAREERRDGITRESAFEQVYSGEQKAEIQSVQANGARRWLGLVSKSVDASRLKRENRRNRGRVQLTTTAAGDANMTSIFA